MSYLVIAYPNISKKDFSWIQNYRKDNDALYYKIVKPHFTIVFPTFDISEVDFINEIEKLSSNIKKFKFFIRCSTIDKDAFNDYYHEFLVPDEGYSNFIKLHDKLYSGKLSANLRLDLDFVPHIGIGNSKNPQVCKKRINVLNEKNLKIKSIIDILDIVKYENDSITSIKKLELN